MATENLIDRKSLIKRHNPVRTASNAASPAQVGNGSFAFGVDITGLQTFIPFATLSDWGWKNDPVPEGASLNRYHGQCHKTQGRPVVYDIPDPELPLESQWFIANPNRINLGRFGLTFGSGMDMVDESALGDKHQIVDLWNGMISSSFRWHNELARIETRVHPTVHAVAVTIDSALVGTGNLSIFLDFPYCSGETKFSAPYVGVWDRPDAHKTVIIEQSSTQACIARDLDDASYKVIIRWNQPGRLVRIGKHHILLSLDSPSSNHLSVTATFCERHVCIGATAQDVVTACNDRWPAFWLAGGAVDLSASTDPRWCELERRIVLSQYVMAVNCLGNETPQESGLVNLGWRGKFHLEMSWWHHAYLGLFGKWEYLDRAVHGMYQRFLPTAIERASAQGYNGARWPKMTDRSGRAGPGEINALLIWQQPHPIAFAELEYRTRKDPGILVKWKDIIAATADFMSSFAFPSAATHYYDLGPPLHIVSENTLPHATYNPGFELTYWRFGLSIAIEWWHRLGMRPEPMWVAVRDNLAPCPMEDGLYVMHAGIIGESMWTNFNFEHPALAGMYGWLPGDIDLEAVRATSSRIWETWKLDDCWGWDFGVLAMNAARLGERNKAVDFLLNENLRVDDVGLADGGSRVPFPYMPSNGALLYAVGFMAAGWSDAPAGKKTPGFPDEWNVRCEGLNSAL